MSYKGHQFVGHFKARDEVLVIQWLVPFRESTQELIWDISKTYHQPKSKWESFAFAAECIDQMECQYI